VILDEVVSEVMLPRVRIRDPMAFSIVAPIFVSLSAFVGRLIMAFDICRPSKNGLLGITTWI
jgi:hypothetical protein